MRTQRFIRALITLAIMIALLPIAGCKKSANPNYRANHVDQWPRIKKSGQLNIGVDDSFVPMDFRQKNGKLVGYDVDLSRAVCKVLGL